MKKKIIIYSKRQGLTLVELLVVLTILVAVASIIIPILPDTNQLSNSSSGSANMREVVKAVETFRSETGTYPDSWDSLIDSSGAVLPTGDGTAGTADLAAPLDISGTPTGDTLIIRDALAGASITEAFQHTDFSLSTVNQTFDGVDTGVNELSSNVAVLTEEGEDRLGLTQSRLGGGAADLEVVGYVALGLGQNSTMVGRAMADAPVKFLRGGENPINQYARWIVIFSVFDDETVRLATVAGLEEDQLRSINFHLDGFYDSF